jgi:hypothetical protein
MFIETKLLAPFFPQRSQIPSSRPVSTSDEASPLPPVSPIEPQESSSGLPSTAPAMTAEVFAPSAPIVEDITAANSLAPVILLEQPAASEQSEQVAPSVAARAASLEAAAKAPSSVRSPARFVTACDLARLFCLGWVCSRFRFSWFSSFMSGFCCFVAFVVRVLVSE